MIILSYNLPVFEARITKLNKKAVKLGLEQISYEVVGTSVRTFLRNVSCEGDTTVEELKLEVTELTVTGTAPKLNGWQVTAKVEATEVKGENFVYRTPLSNPDADLSHLRCIDLHCDHCNTKRAKKNLYQITHEDGTVKNVGATCLKDFTGCDNVEQILSFLGGVNDIEIGLGEYEEGSGRGHQVFEVKDILTRAYYLIKQFGFVSRQKTQETGEASTSEFVHPMNPVWKEVKFDAVTLTGDQVKELVNNAVEWIASQKPGTDYIYNLQLAAKKEYTVAKHFGILSAGMNSYLKELEKRAAVAEKTRSNEHFGQVGQRVTLPELTIVGVFATESQYGTTYITRLEDAAGNLFVWFASRNLGNVGEKFNLKATIKNHDCYNGRKQTIITRAAEV